MDWTMFTVIAGVAVWWTFAVVTVVLAVTADEISSSRDFGIVLGLCVLWPISAVLFVPAILYQAAVASTRRIRIDLNNRGVLRDFEQWLRERDSNIQPKE
jgi:hypothetical protein